MLAQSERTVVRPIDVSDAAFLFQLVHSPDWIKYIGKRELADIAAAEKYIEEGFIKVQAEHGFSYYLVSNRQGVKLGIAGFLKKGYLQNPDFGFAFLSHFCGQGYAYESCQKILDYGIAECGLTQIDAVTMDINLASMALLEKLGFVYIEDIVEPEKNERLSLYRFN